MLHILFIFFLFIFWNYRQGSLYLRLLWWLMVWISLISILIESIVTLFSFLILLILFIFLIIFMFFLLIKSHLIFMFLILLIWMLIRIFLILNFNHIIIIYNVDAWLLWLKLLFLFVGIPCFSINLEVFNLMHF